MSVEDQRFYDHSGIDADARRRRGARQRRRRDAAREGGSTITQQLARQSFLSRDKTYRRKLKEVILAAYIESLYKKNEILELYLNKVYFGDGLYGVEAAARGYFGKSSSELTVDEAALLAGLIKSPVDLRADGQPRSRARAAQRRAADDGGDGRDRCATAEQARRPRAVKLVNALEIRETYGLYFKEQVRRELVERFGWQRVYQGGLRVYTTIDSDLQQHGRSDCSRTGWRTSRSGSASSSHAARRAARSRRRTSRQRARLSAGGARRHRSGDGTRARRWSAAATSTRAASTARCRRGGSPGSAFKPFVYAAALEAGYSPATLITDLNEPVATLQGDWMPEDEHSTPSAMTLRTALRTSSNRAAVQLLQRRSAFRRRSSTRRS